jgi:large repetitive protein
MKKMPFFPLLTALLIMLTIPLFSQQFAPPAAINQSFKALPAGEFPVNSEQVLYNAPFDQLSPSIAFNGTIYLVVWTDSRSTLDHDIYGARIDVNGNLLDPAGILICGAAHSQRNPSVVSNGEIFMVAWEDDRNSGTSGTDIYAARVNPEGAVLDLNGIAVSTAVDKQTIPDIGSAEGNFFAVWVDRRSGTNNDIYGAFISNTGAVANPDGLDICTQTGWQDAPAIAFDGARYFIVWADQRGFSKDIYGTFLKTDGTLSHANGTGIVTLFNNQENPDITWGGTQYFLAWEENQSGFLTKIHGARVTTSGSLIDVNGIPIAAVTDAACTDPSVSSMDANFIVAYTKSMDDT